MLRNGNSIVPLRVKRFPHILVFQAEVSIVEVIHPAQVGFREDASRDAIFPVLLMMDLVILYSGVGTGWFAVTLAANVSFAPDWRSASGRGRPPNV